jgi:hypothetical protein
MRTYVAGPYLSEEYYHPSNTQNVYLELIVGDANLTSLDGIVGSPA